MCDMKEMIYQAKNKCEVLFSGKYKNYDFYIMNLGTHPTSYVDVKNTKYRYKHYDNIDILVHGGLTYSDDHLNISDEVVNGWFIGWDYAHCDDYYGYEEALPFELRTNGKKWTTEEIFEDVKSVIKQLIEKEF